MARWHWIVWPFILLQLVKPAMVWGGSMFRQQPVSIDTGNTLDILQPVASLGLGVWFAWCLPLIWAYDPASLKKVISGDIAPRRVAKWMGFATQLFPVIPLLFTVIMATLVFAELGKPEWFEHVVWLVISLVMLLVSLLISRRVHAVVSLEFPRRVALLGLCFGCGYNLTATAGSNCPECGRRNQSVEPPRPKP